MWSPHSRRTVAVVPVAVALAALAAVVPVQRSGAQQQRRQTPDTALVGQTGADSALPSVVVVPFEFAAPLPGPRYVPHGRPPRLPMGPPGMLPGLPGASPTMRRPARMTATPPPPPDDDDMYLADVGSQIGAGVADLLVERLVAAGGLRVLDRRWLAAHSADSTARTTRPRYTLAGSVTRFDVEERDALGGLGRLAGLGGFGLRRPRTTVTLVARVVDGRTGDVVATAHADGVSRRGSGLTLGGIVRGGGGIVSVGSKAFRESALGEATDRAVADLARQIAGQKGRLAERE